MLSAWSATPDVDDERQALGEHLALAAACCRSGAYALTVAAPDDPLQLNLPPIIGGGAGGLPPAALHALAAHYFQAELEQAGVIPVVEVLVRDRLSLTHGTARLAKRLEQFARQQRDWYDRAQRDILFARAFGVGSAATNEHGATVNREFQQHMANLCVALLHLGQKYASGRVVARFDDTLVRQAMRGLLLNLAPFQFSGALLAVGRIQAELQAAVDILSDADLTALVDGHSLWDRVRLLLGQQAPDVERLVRRGQSGLRLLDWLATLVPGLADESSWGQVVASADAPAFTWATTWLDATGLPTTELAGLR
jgi:hypothetical protein